MEYSAVRYTRYSLVQDCSVEGERGECSGTVELTVHTVHDESGW